MSSSFIGVFGGTFDPIHCGHIAVAEFLTQTYPLQEIHFIPCQTPPHRTMPHATPAQRLEMIKLAIAGHKSWIADDIDLQRPGPSYMVDTLELLHQRQPLDSWCLILGMDAFLQLDQWKDWHKILTQTHLLVVNRPGYNADETHWSHHILKQKGVANFQELKRYKTGKILILTMPPVATSATQIREQNPINIPYALPPAVLKYIQEQRLYKI